MRTNGGFPSNSYQQSNYYVDVIVAPEGTPTPTPARPTPTPTPGPTPPPSGSPVALLDASVSGDAVSASTTVTSTALSTSSGNELLLAFVAADYLSGDQYHSHQPHRRRSQLDPGKTSERAKRHL